MGKRPFFLAAAKSAMEAVPSAANRRAASLRMSCARLALLACMAIAFNSLLFTKNTALDFRHAPCYNCNRDEMCLSWGSPRILKVRPPCSSHLHGGHSLFPAVSSRLICGDQKANERKYDSQNFIATHIHRPLSYRGDTAM